MISHSGCFELSGMPRPRKMGSYKKYLRDPYASIPKTTAWLRKTGQQIQHTNSNKVCITAALMKLNRSTRSIISDALT